MPKGSDPLRRLNGVLTSNAVLVILLVFPVFFVFTRLFPVLRVVPTPLTGLLIDNVCILLVIALRFARMAARLFKEQQYGSEGQPDGASLPVSRTAEELRHGLADKGYRFDVGGTYGEKRTPAFFGATLLWGGVLLAMLLGSVDYVRQYSKVLLLGVGNPSQIGGADGVVIGQGYFAGGKGLPLLQVKQQIPPNAQWPYGATEIALVSEEGKELAQKTVVWGGEPLRYGGFEYHMGRFLYDAVLNITSSTGYLEFNDAIKLQPLWDKSPRPPFTHSATFRGVRGDWTAFYDPRSKTMRLEMAGSGGTTAEGEVVFQRDMMKPVGGFVAGIDYLGSWSEIHVVRHRHTSLIVFGAVVALMGALLRLFFGPQRIWLEDAPGGCRVRTIGPATRRLLEQYNAELSTSR